MSMIVLRDIFFPPLKNRPGQECRNILASQPSHFKTKLFSTETTPFIVLAACDSSFSF